MGRVWRKAIRGSGTKGLGNPGGGAQAPPRAQGGSGSANTKEKPQLGSCWPGGPILRSWQKASSPLGHRSTSSQPTWAQTHAAARSGTDPPAASPLWHRPTSSPLRHKPTSSHKPTNSQPTLAQTHQQPAHSGTDPPAARSGTDPPAARSGTDPPAARSGTDPPAASPLWHRLTSSPLGHKPTNSQPTRPQTHQQSAHSGTDPPAASPHGRRPMRPGLWRSRPGLLSVELHRGAREKGAGLLSPAEAGGTQGLSAQASRNHGGLSKEDLRLEPGPNLLQENRGGGVGSPGPGAAPRRRPQTMIHTREPG